MPQITTEHFGFVYILLAQQAFGLPGGRARPLPLCLIFNARDIIGAQKMFVVLCLFKVKAIIHKIHTSDVLRYILPLIEMHPFGESDADKNQITGELMIF